MKSFLILIFFIIIVYLTYKFSYKKHYKNKKRKNIENLVLPIDITDQFKYSSLKNLYFDIFNNQDIKL